VIPAVVLAGLIFTLLSCGVSYEHSLLTVIPAGFKKDNLSSSELKGDLTTPSWKYHATPQQRGITLRVLIF